MPSTRRYEWSRTFARDSLTRLSFVSPSSNPRCSAVSSTGAIAWGLMFLLAAEAQAEVVRRVSRALRAGGSFLFTSPFQSCTWSDSLTGHLSISLGADTYRHLLAAEGLTVVSEFQDAGDNYYYQSRKV
jgi:hypothetical protein